MRRPGSENFFQSALDALSAHVVVLDAAGTILAVNEAWRRFAAEHGLADPSYGVGENYFAVCARVGHAGVCNDGAGVAAGIRAVASATSPRFTIDYASPRAGEERWFQLTATPFAEAEPRRVVVAHEDITARKQNEQQLRAGDERYRAFLSQSSEAIWRFELPEPMSTSLPVDEQVDYIFRHARLAECNDVSARMYGFASGDEIVGRPLSDFLPRDEVNVRYLEAFVRSRYRLTDAESYEIDRDGRRRVFQNNLIGIVNAGRVLRAWGTQRDVTEQKRAEAALRDSEHKLRIALDAARLGIWEWHPDGSRVLSDSYADVVGAAPPTHEEFVELVHPDDRNALLSAVQRALHETGVYHCEYRVLPPDGRERWIAGYGRVVPDAYGRPDHMIGVVMDVTERRQAEMRHDEARRMMQLALEVARAGAWEWAPGSERFVGDAGLARIFRLPVEDVVAGRVPQRALFDAMHPDDRKHVAQRMAAALDEGGEYELEFRVTRDGGAPVWLNSRGMVHLGRDGRAERVNGLLFDVTAQKELERDTTLLAELSERIRLSDDAGALLDEVVRLLDEHLDGVRCVFARARELGGGDASSRGWVLHDADNGPLALPPGEPLPSPARVLEDLAAGRTVAIDDAADDARVADDWAAAPAALRPLRALVAVPQLREGRWTLVLAAVSESPRRWTRREIGLLEAVAERTWNAVEKIRLDAKLRESEQRYRLLVSVTTAIVAIADADGRFTTHQPTWEAYTGQPWQQHRDYGYLDAVHPDERAEAAEAWATARREGRVFYYETRLHHAPTRSYRYCVVRVVPAFTADGRVREWVSSIVDVDEQRRAEMQLRASEAEWRLVFESAREYAIFTLDRERRIIRWNAGATRLLGYGESEIVGSSGDIFFTPEDRADLAPLREVELAASQGRAENERWHVRRDGSRFWGSGAVMPITAESGEIVGFVKILRDMTASKRAEEEREELLRIAERARAEAESANAAKDAFLATLSHELRSPLQAAIGWVTLLRSGNLSHEQRDKAVRTLERSIRHQVQLVNDLLDVSRILTGKFHLEWSVVDLVLAVEQVRDELQLDARSKQIEITFETEPDCGAVLGDAQRLGQIFRNLIANAIKFTPPGGRVSIRCGSDGEMAVVTVTDTGQGIPADFLPQIFDRFSQADSSITRQHGGLGLGLGIVRHLVGLHGGTVEAASPGPGQGATFRVRLPLVTAPAWPTIESTAGVVDRGRPEGLAGVRVFLVEDDAVTRDALAVLLQQAGARVTVAGAAREALELLAGGSPDVIVTDIGMPGEDGFWLAQRVRAAQIDVPIVALTGFADEQTKNRVAAEGIRAHVVKPVDAESLVSAIRSVLEPSTAARGKRPLAGARSTVDVK